MAYQYLFGDQGKKIKLLIVLIISLFFIGACMDLRNLARASSSVEEKSPQDKNQERKSIMAEKTEEGKCIYGCSGTSMAQNAQVVDSKSQSVSSDYTLGPEDVIDVSVWKNENLSKTVIIRPDGKISLPLVGDVQAAGLTTSQLRDYIKDKLKEYKETPEVSIIVKEINSLVVYVLGEVAHPGKFNLRSDTSILQAITLSGGFTQYASTSQIVLLRRVGGVETRKTIRYKDIVSGHKPEDDLLLQRGDTIIVP